MLTSIWQQFDKEFFKVVPVAVLLEGNIAVSDTFLYQSYSALSLSLVKPEKNSMLTGHTAFELKSLLSVGHTKQKHMHNWLRHF